MGNSEKTADKPMSERLMTPWSGKMTEPPWSEYPRPQLQRDTWRNLNGLWRCRIVGNEMRPHEAGEMVEVRESDRPILVPFCLESTLGGVRHKLEPNEELWYYRAFDMEDLDTFRQLDLLPIRLFFFCPQEKWMENVLVCFKRRQCIYSYDTLCLAFCSVRHLKFRYASQASTSFWSSWLQHNRMAQWHPDWWALWWFLTFRVWYHRCCSWSQWLGCASDRRDWQLSTTRETVQVTSRHLVHPCVWHLANSLAWEGAKQLHQKLKTWDHLRSTLRACEGFGRGRFKSTPSSGSREFTVGSYWMQRWNVATHLSGCHFMVAWESISPSPQSRTPFPRRGPDSSSRSCAFIHGDPNDWQEAGWGKSQPGF